MKKPSFFLETTIVRFWFTEKSRFFTSSEKQRKKSQDFINNHCCLLIKIPYVNPLIRRLFLMESPLYKLVKQKKHHTFQIEQGLKNRELALSVEPADAFDQSHFSKNVIDLPLKEHLLATKRLEQASFFSRDLHKENLMQVSIFENEPPPEKEELFPHDWIFQRKEERQFQIDRVIKSPST